MDKGKEYFIEDTIKSTEKLINEISVDGLQLDLTTDTGKKIKNEIHKKEIESLDFKASPIVDGFVEIRASKDDMIVTTDFYPPSEDGKSIEEDDVRDKLESYGIVYGVDWDIINSKIDQCNNERIQINDVIIVRGDTPVDEVSQHLVIEERLLKDTRKIEEESPIIDYKQITSYTLVKKGETLAQVIQLKEGKFGKTVKGELIPFKKTHIIQKKHGKNTKLENNKIVAACDGRFELRSNHFWVNEVFEILGDVNYRTGNISFPGDIIIHGRVNDGFKVESGGSVFCKGTLDASEVVCEKNLVINRGIIGRKKGKVKVGGITSAKYIENCYVESQDSIYIETGILHSIIHTLSKLEMGIDSIIVGGKIFAQNGIIAHQIGTKMGIKTEIGCGTDYTIQQKLEWIKEKTVALALKLGQIEEIIKSRDADNKKLLEMRDKIKNSIHKLNEATRALIIHLDKNENAEIVVKGTVFPGVYIEICHISYVVPRNMEGVRFFLDKKKGQIDWDVIL